MCRPPLDPIARRYMYFKVHPCFLYFSRIFLTSFPAWVHFQKDYPLTLLFSAVDDKDYTDMIRTILGKISFHHVIVTQVGGYRKVPAEKLAEIFREKGCPTAEACEDVEEAFKKALAAKGEDGMLFCVGSLYLVGEIKTLILQGVGK